MERSTLAIAWVGSLVGGHFTVVIDIGVVKYVEIEKTTTGLLTNACIKGMRVGKFAPAPFNGASLAEGGASGTGTPAAQQENRPSASGLSIRATPEGAYIAAIMPGSPAAAAELVPGMVITAVNGILLVGMGDAMIKVIAASTGATVTILGGESVKLGLAD